MAQIIKDLTLHNTRLIKEVTRLRRAIMLDVPEAKWNWRIDDAT